jgi:DNA helicase-2/ATP-dependent DNA helicase PcrA
MKSRILEYDFARAIAMIFVIVFHMHSSLGGIIDANEEITPHKKAITAEEIEEERRMFYVAMTRAKNNLKIMYAKERYNKELEVSRFVREIMGEEYRNELYQEHNL